MENIQYENKNICAECKGFCCKKSGCDYFVSDFESMDTNYLENFLRKGYSSIIASLDFKRLSNDKIVVTPILYLRARNINRDIVDLLSMKTTCMSLGENGCLFNINQRPSGGVTLIPKENMKCYSIIDRNEELLKWLPYQKILHRLVKRFTGMSVDAKLREDIENLIFDLLSNNIEGVSKLELEDVKAFLPALVEAFPEENHKAYIRYKNAKNILIKK